MRRVFCVKLKDMNTCNEKKQCRWNEQVEACETLTTPIVCVTYKDENQCNEKRPCRWNEQVEACEDVFCVKYDMNTCKAKRPCRWNEQVEECETLTMPSYRDALPGRVYKQMSHYGEILEQFNMEQEAEFEKASGTL